MSQAPHSRMGEFKGQAARWLRHAAESGQPVVITQNGKPAGVLVSPELPGTGVREIIEGRYRIVYRIRAKGIQVLTVFEGRRQFPTDDVGE